MIRSLILALLLALSIGAPVAAAQEEVADPGPAPVTENEPDDEKPADEEPADPEPIEDFWTAEAEAIKRERAALPPAPVPGAPAPATAPAAAPAGPAPAPGAAPVCDPALTLQAAIEALRPLAQRPMPYRAGRALGTLKVKPCMPGRLRLEVVAADSGRVLVRAERMLRTTKLATFKPVTTRAIRRYAGRGPMQLRLRATFTRR